MGMCMHHSIWLLGKLLLGILLGLVPWESGHKPQRRANITSDSWRPAHLAHSPESMVTQTITESEHYIRILYGHRGHNISTIILLGRPIWPAPCGGPTWPTPVRAWSHTGHKGERALHMTLVWPHGPQLDHSVTDVGMSSPVYIYIYIYGLTFAVIVKIYIYKYIYIHMMYMYMHASGN